MNITLKKAHIKDVKTIHALVNYFAKKDQMLPRALNDIYENLQSYIVAVSGKNQVIGCCSLSITWEDLAEIRSLAVDHQHLGKGIGKKLVSQCIKEAKKMGIKRVFALTFKPGYFRKLGFQDISRDELPHKVWGDCIRCHLFPDCGEFPVIMPVK